MKRLLHSYRLKRTWGPWVISTLCGLSSLLLTICLCTYHEHDPSWFYHSSHQLPTHNSAGVVGAYIAALLMYLFGSASFVLIPLLVFWSYTALQGISWQEERDRIIATMSMIMIAAPFATSVLSESSGGLLGYLLLRLCTMVFDHSIISIGLGVSLYATLIVISRMQALLLVVAAVQFLCSRERFLMPLFFITRTLCKAVFASITYLVGILYELITLHKQGESVVIEDFERMIKEELGHVVKDPFWKTYTEDPILSTQHISSDIYSDKPLIEEQTKQSAEYSNQGGRVYQLPQHMFTTIKKSEHDTHQLQEDQHRAALLEEKLARFGIEGSVVSIKTGPVVTLFEYQPTIDTKLSKILALEDDLALALQALSIRILAPIPGTSVVGFEVANKKRSSVTLASIIHTSEFKQFKGHLPLVLGVDTVGEAIVVDLVTMPHLLVAGATGSGKSVALNAMLVSLLYALRPDQMKLILIDPKRLEFASYQDIAHLLVPIVTEPKDVIHVLRWVVHTMEERYRIMAALGVRHVFDYQRKASSDATLEPMPFIVVMIDELSDLMMTTGKEVEELIARIAQMARAAGIHMIVATQRPSVDVITGLIKVNFPSRIAFRVTSKVDSRTILDTMGAEKLLGKGDMLFLHAHAFLQRIHGAYVSDEEIRELVQFIRSQEQVVYQDIVKSIPQSNDELSSEDDQLYQEVLEFLKTVDEISISLLQRRFRIGYNRSARIMELLEMHGLILPHDGSKMRKVIHTQP